MAVGAEGIGLGMLVVDTASGVAGVGGEDDGGFDLAVGDIPVAAEEVGFLGGWDEVEAVALVEADGPAGVGPGADEEGAGGEVAEVVEEMAADATVLLVRADVGVANEGDVLHWLKAHDAEQSILLVEAPELDAVVDLVAEFGLRHVGRGIAVGGDDAAVRFGGVVDEGEKSEEVGFGAGADGGDHYGKALTLGSGK